MNLRLAFATSLRGGARFRHCPRPAGPTPRAARRRPSVLGRPRRPAPVKKVLLSAQKPARRPLADWPACWRVPLPGQRPAVLGAAGREADRRQPHLPEPQALVLRRPDPPEPDHRRGLLDAARSTPTLQANIGQFYADVTQSTYWAWLHEYDTRRASRPAPTRPSCRGPSAATSRITPLKCAPGGGNCKLTDNDIQAELTRQINMRRPARAHARLHRATSKTIYMVDFPPNISLTAARAGSGKSCVQFCAYHNTGTYGPSNVAAHLRRACMDMFTGPCSLGCGGNATALAERDGHRLARARRGGHRPGHRPRHCRPTTPSPPAGATTTTSAARSATSAPTAARATRSPSAAAPGSCSSSGATSRTSARAPGPLPADLLGDDAHGLPQVLVRRQRRRVQRRARRSARRTSGNVLFGGCEQCTATSGTCTGGGTCQQSATPVAGRHLLGLHADRPRARRPTTAARSPTAAAAR